ncbi:hypothetical protein RR42_s1275 [Cupriavidus basilensis]|uniref:Uncharacterized protein n=1 Tax=Cupriavidus basilensis TaxID=68895 RepID=A0A0C4YIK2_9BURK|nr:hypothetical protein RR42_s1275 [Cupriavidus basilensis]
MPRSAAGGGPVGPASPIGRRGIQWHPPAGCGCPRLPRQNRLDFASSGI